MSTYKKKTGLTFYTVATVVTLVVGTVYEFFSHQVYSPFMYLLFMIPLVLGVVPNLIAKMTGKTFLESEDAQAAYKMGVLTFIFGSFLKGVFDIYGTSSVYPTLYLPVGALLLVAALGLEMYYKKAVAKYKEGRSPLPGSGLLLLIDNDYAKLKISNLCISIINNIHCI